MKVIKVLGTGCAKCKTLTANAIEAAKQAGIEIELIKIEDIEEILTYQVMTTPALLVDEVIKVKGRVAEVNEIKEILLDV